MCKKTDITRNRVYKHNVANTWYKIYHNNGISKQKRKCDLCLVINKI